MLDTIKLGSPDLSPLVAERIKNKICEHRRLDPATGEVTFSYRSDLPGPFGSQVRVMLLETQEEYAPAEMAPEEPTAAADAHFAIARVREWGARVIIEGSIHKLLLGHNICGGPTSFLLACRWFIALVSRLLTVTLPQPEDWLVERVDWAEVYTLDSSLIPNFMAGLQHAHYPCRVTNRYGTSGYAFPGQTTTLSIYHKGPEFEQSDRRHLTNGYTDSERNILLSKAWERVRIEVQVKSPKLRRDFHGKPHVSDVTEDHLRRLFDQSLLKLHFDVPGSQIPVRTVIDVEARLIAVYGHRGANSLIGAWHRLVDPGEAVLRTQVPRASLARWKKGLLDAGCSWLATGFASNPSSLPPDFRLTRDSPCRDTSVDPRVTERLAAYQTPSCLEVTVTRSQSEALLAMGR